jgi:hypothetical protein
MLDWLKTILGDTYTDDIDKKVSAEIGKTFVSRADFNTLNETKKTLETQVSDRDKQLETLKKSSGDNEALKKQITDLQTANKQAKTDYDANLKKLTLGSKIDVALMGAKAKNVKAVRALLDESKISLDGENVLGLNEQLGQIQKDNPYLFGEDAPKNPPAPAGGEPPKPNGSDSFLAAAMKGAGLKPENIENGGK